MKVLVVIPCYRVRDRILGVIAGIGPEVAQIVVVDDKCPDQSGEFVSTHCKDSRVIVLRNEQNLGVGGATIRGYRYALETGAEVVVKLDGDGQMNPELIPALIEPILRGEADYVKGNRFFDLAFLKSMPPIRLFGNSVLSFVSKLSSGYWNLMDPTNGFTAIHHLALSQLPLNKIANDYFFESDMLFRLNVIRAVVHEMPMAATYADEESSMDVVKVVLSFPRRYASRFGKRIFYSYYLRNFTVTSVELLFGVPLLVFGVLFGSYRWYISYSEGVIQSTGTVMLAVLPIIIGFQSILSAIGFDVQNTPRIPLQKLLSSR